MVSPNSSQKKKQTSVLRAHNFQKLYGTNLVGGGTQYDFRFELFNEKIKIDANKSWSYISDALIILTPQAAKKLFTILDKYVKEFEKDHGTIKDPDPIQKNDDISSE
jgi:hypothetical protein